MNEYTFPITEEYEGNRLDVVISEFLEDKSRSYLQKLIKDGQVTVNDTVAKASVKVKENDVVRITIPESEPLFVEAQDIPLDILFEDEDMLVINKPKGMVCHPSNGHMKDTLVNAVMFHCKDHLSGINGVLRPGIVHRIDMNTTGSVMVCKNDLAHQSIAAQLKEHSIVRRYVAICYGVIKEDDITIDKPLGRDPKDRKKMAVVQDGKHAVTHVHVLKRFKEYTYIECRLETGRTHQIRVHLASIGHPLLGDETYAGKRKCPYHLEGQCLHAAILGFEHPRTHEYVETKAPLPLYFESLLQKLP